MSDHTDAGECFRREALVRKADLRERKRSSAWLVGSRRGPSWPIHGERILGKALAAETDASPPRSHRHRRGVGGPDDRAPGMQSLSFGGFGGFGGFGHRGVEKLTQLIHQQSPEQSYRRGWDECWHVRNRFCDYLLLQPSLIALQLGKDGDHSLL